jgi:hypothetical protein
MIVVSDPKERTSLGLFQENIWVYESGSNRKREKTAKRGAS